jgi:hypothetical protein
VKVVEPCGCWTERMPDGGVDQLVCAHHTAMHVLFFTPTQTAAPIPPQETKLLPSRSWFRRFYE